VGILRGIIIIIIIIIRNVGDKKTNFVGVGAINAWM
jgi:hypothetical protein